MTAELRRSGHPMLATLLTVSLSGLAQGVSSRRDDRQPGDGLADGEVLNGLLKWYISTMLAWFTLWYRATHRHSALGNVESGRFLLRRHH
jgi:hypothetical protein